MNENDENKYPSTTQNLDNEKKKNDEDSWFNKWMQAVR